MGVIVAVLNVIDRQGRSHELEAVEGWRVMEILRDYKVGIEGVCGGSCDCGTCHVIVAQEWAGKLPEPRNEEIIASAYDPVRTFVRATRADRTVTAAMPPVRRRPTPAERG